MRQNQNQHSKRSRGRGRRQGNAVNRSYESNGPDVKIRGTAAHILEKYQSLSRDANVSGDRISAENYLQHAEHYYRLLTAAQQQQQQQQQQNGKPSVSNGDSTVKSDDQEAEEAQVPAAAKANGGEAPTTDSEVP